MAEGSVVAGSADAAAAACLAGLPHETAETMLERVDIDPKKLPLPVPFGTAVFRVVSGPHAPPFPPAVGPTFFGFHGTDTANWQSILEDGFTADEHGWVYMARQYLFSRYYVNNAGTAGWKALGIVEASSSKLSYPSGGRTPPFAAAQQVDTAEAPNQPVQQQAVPPANLRLRHLLVWSGREPPIHYHPNLDSFGG